MSRAQGDEAVPRAEESPLSCGKVRRGAGGLVLREEGGAGGPFPECHYFCF